MARERVRWIAATLIVVLLVGTWLATQPDGEAEVVGQPEPEPDDKASAAGLAFVDVGGQVGLSEVQSDETLPFGRAMTGGAAVSDFDDDGIMDVFLTRIGLPNQLYRGISDGSFVDITEQAGVGGDPAGGSAAAVWADVDGDEDPDLFVGGTGTTRNRLYINAGDGTFTDETRERGLLLPKAPTLEGDVFSEGGAFGASLSDWDLDGDLDLMVTHWNPAAFNGFYVKEQGGLGSPCDVASAPLSGRFLGQLESNPSRARMYENDGTGHFRDGTAELGLDFSRMLGFTPVFADIDGDGWDDLLVTGDFCTSRVYQNEGGRQFRDVTSEAGVGTDENGMGSVVEDLNGDGYMDWFITGISGSQLEGGCPSLPTIGCSGNRLFLGNGSGSFTDATDAYGVRDVAWGWGAAAPDLDHDGVPDLVAVNGFLDSDTEAAQSGDGAPREVATMYQLFSEGRPALWRGSADLPWSDVASAAGLVGTGRAKAVVPFDHDSDGDTDLLVTNTGGKPNLFRNETADVGDWLTVRLSDGTTANTRGVGAKVGLELSDSTSQVAQVRAGGSYQSSAPQEVHFGLGTSEVAVVEVTWPGETEPQVVKGPDSNQILRISRNP